MALGRIETKLKVPKTIVVEDMRREIGLPQHLSYSICGSVPALTSRLRLCVGPNPPRELRPIDRSVVLMHHPKHFAQPPPESYSPTGVLENEVVLVQE